ncbi:barstar family protein [Pseudomonas sp. 43A]|jgi:ribonuclease inhibitor|uniref:barstar family protein n=1 Tax=Pseudomonas TaxID=286 RepID=UPI0015875A6D|nr:MULTISPECIES: barstar family protein [Pseudomonas]QKV65141.1 barstar family protein [Pseudomonas sp. 43A]QMW12405.1 barstar family protein [Pseudomonas sp. 29A]QUE92168.1 barstar family protein [Pseudomonas sp. SCA2728.1_7]
MIVELDGLSISSEQEFHKRIASAFSVTQYYGNNLNALWDLLSTDVERPIELIWTNSKHSEELMGDSYRKILIILDRVKTQDENFGLDEKFSYQLK